MNIRELKKRFAEIKQTYFPRWDRTEEWKIRATSKRGAYGFCVYERKVIEFSSLPADPDDRDQLLIHEICHAVSTRGHGVDWERRMRVAADRAETLNRLRLAQLLRDDAHDFGPNGGGWGSEAHIKGTVSEYLMYRPDLTLEEVEIKLADDNGGTVDKLRHVFKRLPAIYQRERDMARLALRIS